MNDEVWLLERIKAGDLPSVDELLPFVYDELGRLARKQLENEEPGQSLQTCDLVHEAYLRLVGSNQEWQGRGHFLAAAAEAMRRILVDRARKKQGIKYGGRRTRVELTDLTASFESSADEVIMVSDLLDTLGRLHPLEAQIVKLHYYAGLNISEAGNAIGVSSSTAHRYWAFARAWLHEAIQGEDANSIDE